MREYIVAVDDDPEIVDSIREMLEEVDLCRIETFINAEEGFRFIRDHGAECRLIITDISMPIMDGITMIEELENLETIPVLFLTSHEDNDIIRDAFAVHRKTLSVNYMIKPFHPIIFRSTVTTLVASARHYGELIHKNRMIGSLLDDVDRENRELIRRLEEVAESEKVYEDRLQKIRNLMKGIFSNDLPLVKFITTVVEENEEILLSIIGEGEALFKVLPQTIEPLKTVIADISTVCELLIGLGILSYNDVTVAQIETTTFYSIIHRVYSNGGFDTDTFKRFLEMADYTRVDDNIIMF